MNRRANAKTIMGKHRWSEKNDPALPPTDASAIQSVTPSDIFNWPGPTERLVPSSERIAAEQKWYALTGRVVELRAEEDGDVHIALQDATGDKPGVVVVEIPAKPQWCQLRQIVFGWTQVQFPFRVRSGRTCAVSAHAFTIPISPSTLSMIRPRYCSATAMDELARLLLNGARVSPH
jgi:hypothetical protein